MKGYTPWAYSQHFIFFVTYKWDQSARMLVPANLSNLVYCNTLANCAHSKAIKKSVVNIAQWIALLAGAGWTLSVLIICLACMALLLLYV
jgi:hypothetical protein